MSSSGTATGPVSGTTAAGRVADVLLAFADGAQSLGVSEVARKVDISKAVVFRIFQSLVEKGFLDKDDENRQYRLGAAAAALGARALQELDMRKAAQSELICLRDHTRETTTLSELVGDKRVYLEQYESAQSIRMTVELGRPYPLHAGASGKAIMAFLGRDRIDELMSRGLDRLTPSTVTDTSELGHELSSIKRAGYAVSLGERLDDAGSVAAPLFDGRGVAAGSVSVCGPLGRFTPAAIAAHARAVVESARVISARMGWHGPYPATVAGGSERDA